MAAIDAVGPEADLIMPTELSTTAYFPVLRDAAFKAWAEPLDGEVVCAVARRARTYRATILFPLYLDLGGRQQNAVLVIGPDGRLIDGVCADGSAERFFAKIHLPDSRRGSGGLDEPFYFAPGDRFPVFDTPAGRIGVLLCYDRRFPEAWRSLVFAGAELIVVPACVPFWKPGARASTADMFVTELRTRACENGVFVACCNRAGEQRLRDVVSRFVGQSCVIDPTGAVLKIAPGDEAATVLADVDLDEVARVRRRLTILRDRRPDAYALDATVRDASP